MGSRTLTLELPSAVDAAARARAALEPLRARMRPERHEALRLVVSELVSNAVKYGPGRPIRLEVEVDDEGAARGQVVDEGDPGRLPELAQDPGPAGGYGLRIVDELAERWGVHEGSTHVWFELGP